MQRGSFLVYYLSALFIFVTGFTFGQGKFCGAISPTPTSEEANKQAILAIKQKFASASIVISGMNHVPIRVNIVRKTNGIGGPTMANLNEAIAKVNKLYKNANIQFFFSEAPRYINSDTFYDYKFSQETALCDPNDANNALNLYLTNKIIFNTSDSVSGYAYFPSNHKRYNRVFVQSRFVNDDRTLAHELGHYFNLYHTFQSNSSSTVSERELVSRTTGSNCSSSGDMLCDTHADPFGLPSSNTLGCNYVGTVRDGNNNLFTPDLSNIMSYYYGCGNAFTPGQYLRIADGLLLRKNPNPDPTQGYSLDSPPATVPAPSGLTSVLGQSSITLNWVDNSANETGFFVERAVMPGGNYEIIAGVAPNIKSYLDNSVSSLVTYQYRIRPSNTINISFSNVSQISTPLVYCTPSYEENCNTSGEVIADFVLRDSTSNTILLNNKNSGCSPNSFGDFTQSVSAPNLVAGKWFNFMANSYANADTQFGIGYNQHIAIWIDLNRDGVFGTSERVYFSPTNTDGMSPTLKGMFQIPATASPGISRMRVRSHDWGEEEVSSPCSRDFFGETEDYSINILSASRIVTLNSASSQDICAGSGVTLMFTASGTYASGNQFRAQMASGNGSFIDIPSVVSGNQITATIPSTATPGNDYSFRVIASLPNTSSNTLSPVTVRVKAAVDVVNGSTTINSGNGASFLVNLSGTKPITYTLSDGSTFSDVNANIQTITKGPVVTTAYTVASVSNSCGSGTTSGSYTVFINNAPSPATITTGSVSSSLVCTGGTIQVPFSTTDFGSSPGFKLQLSDATGSNFSDVSATLNGTTFTHQIASSQSPGTGYRYRVVADNPSTIGSPSGTFTIRPRSTATITGTTAIQAGQSANLVVNLTGTGPWSYSLSNGQSFSNVSVNSPTVSVTPSVTTIYSVNSVTNSECGNGIPIGQATVTVNPNVNSVAHSITMTGISKTSFCVGEELDVFYSAVGTYQSNNQFVIQISDLNGVTYQNLPTTVSGSMLIAFIPQNMAGGTSYRIRVASTNPIITSSAWMAPITVRSKPTATLSGGSTITAGQTASLTLNTTGANPIEVKLSTGQVFSNIFGPTATIQVSPTQTTTFFIDAVSNLCGQGMGNGSATVTVNTGNQITNMMVVCPDVQVWLEGTYTVTSGMMTTTLNQYGLLPGQIPTDTRFLATPNGQPYKLAPWNYTGSESVSSYATDIVDWLLVSYRSETDFNQLIARRAVLLKSNGTTVGIGGCPTIDASQKYYITVEHRNHLGVMTPMPVAVFNGKLTYDFRNADSYKNQSFGQKQITTAPSRWGMILGDGQQTNGQNFDINSVDLNLWKGENGSFGKYMRCDFNLDGDTNATDLNRWKSNNGKFSAVPRQ